MVLVLVLSLSGCKSTVVWPSVTTDAARLRYPGKFVWFDLYTADIIVAGQFYDAVFGWSLERTDRDNGLVKTIFAGGLPIGNILEQSGASHWVSYVSVDNVDQVFDTILGAGGLGRVSPGKMPDRGRVARIIDPGGAEIGLVASPVGDPADSSPQNGHWLGAELWTGDVAAAASFYSAMVGYKAYRADIPGKGPFRLLVRNKRPRAGVGIIPSEGISPQWVPQVAVLDLDATLKLVEVNGGAILVRPLPGVDVGRSAVFTDPSGAVLGIREFIPPED